ncbi:class I SAM-dependent methyltransferase [Phenylobacterium sp. 20VBR1]|uniref:Class I SAM-dependent methyltransferase n=2 Tax=Phenylobacterium glaciei TaxID=2803784 RepID=A0A941D3N8_9CAUL|nr:class I SAM-dependent methyltransferase [Phenylobacterium glaciei]
MSVALNAVERMDALAEGQGGFFYPWTSTLGADDGEDAYTALVERHLSPDLSVLEAGCGHGPDVLRFAPQVARYGGYDFSEGFVRIAGARAAAAGLTNVELICSNSSAGANDGRPRIPMPDASVDMIVSRRGPTNFILDAPRVVRPGGWLIQLNPMPSPRYAWDDELPEDLRSEPARDFDMAGHICGLLAQAGLALHSSWAFDVPEYFTDARQLYAYLAWNQFHGLGLRAQPLESALPALEAVMERHAGPEGLDVRRRRYLWSSRIL